MGFLYSQVHLVHNHLTCTSLNSWNNRHIPSNPLIGWDGVLRIFCPDLESQSSWSLLLNS
jgi:hypothetical protein